jgi:signal transduction histidine kinase
LALLELLIAGETTQYSLEKRYIHKNRAIVWVTLNVSLMRSPTGEPRYIIGVIQDITERKQAEVERKRAEAQLKQKAQDLEAALQELQQTQTQLVQSEKMSSLGQLVAGVAHEINNPVNFIYGNLKHATQYINDLLHLVTLYQECYPTPNPKVQAESEAIDLDFLMADLPKLITSMRVGADRIREIIASLRNFSRLDEAEFKTVNIHDGIDSTLLILQHRLKARADFPEIKIVKQYGDLPLVKCFPGQLNQVFMNILVNGIDALEEWQEAKGERQQADLETFAPQITIWTETKGDRVLIRIADNGPGIPEDVQQRLFDPFFTTKPVGKGTGLGMSISYQIVEKKHSGSLRCTSIPGQGAEFAIEIPIQPAR